MDYRVDPGSDCWLWNGYVAPNGYGRKAFHGGRSVPAHRHIYEQERGPVPEGHELHHTCRNRSCVNPTHLQPITHLLHMRLEKSPLCWADVVAIRESDEPSHALAARYKMSPGGIRSVRANKVWHDPDYVPKSRVGRKLTDDQIRVIRASGEPTKALARRYGVSQKTMQAIRRGLTYKSCRS